MQKLKNIIKSTLTYLVIKTKSIPYLYFKTNFGKYVNILLISNLRNSHYVLMNDFNIFLTNKTKHHGKSVIFVDIAYNPSTPQKY